MCSAKVPSGVCRLASRIVNEGEQCGGNIFSPYDRYTHSVCAKGLECIFAEHNGPSYQTGAPGICRLASRIVNSGERCGDRLSSPDGMYRADCAQGLKCTFDTLTGTGTNQVVVPPGMVSCGGHFKKSCGECPDGHGKSWCNGQCAWVAMPSPSNKELGTCSPKVFSGLCLSRG